jgi:hypothetical protein
MAVQTEFPMFCEREKGKLFAFYSLYRIKNTIKKLPQIVFKNTIKKLPQIVYRLANECLAFKMVTNIYF